MKGDSRTHLKEVHRDGHDPAENVTHAETKLRTKQRVPRPMRRDLLCKEPTRWGFCLILS
jgi:hypothetical protein